MDARTTLRKAVFAMAALQLATAGHLLAQPKTYDVRKEDSHIGFTVYKWAVFKEEGRFKDFAGSIVYDKKNPSASRVEFTVQAKSIDSRNDGRDSALRSEEFFYVERFPTLTFKSTQVLSKGVDTLLVTGNLTMRGATKRITIPVRVLGTHQVREIGELAGFESSFTINREDFGIARGWDIISKEARIDLMIGAASRMSSTSL
jgi:polyisoprenoid-binding protein YceI